MVLELIAIGVGIYLLARHKKNKRERAAAYAAGNPFRHQDGSITYPPGYQGCPTHGGNTAQQQQQRPVGGYYDGKRQDGNQNMSQNQQGLYSGPPRYDAGVQQGQEVPRYTDAEPMRDQKGGKVKEPEVREVRSEKEEYVHV